MDACREFVDETRSYGASRVCTTLTSAARDVSNGDALLEQLGDLGLEPQVIPGEVEARLTFYGVAHDFPGGGSRRGRFGRRLDRNRGWDICAQL